MRIMVGLYATEKGEKMTDKAKVCDKIESEHLDKTFPHEEKGIWYDITEMLTYCDVIDSCEDCPRYAEDCDGREIPSE